MKNQIVLGILVVTGTINVHAETLKDVVGIVLNTNPIVNERFRNYNATKSEISISEAGYYPTLNLESSTGRKTTGRISNKAIDETYSVFQNSLILRQNIFNGFSTDEKVNYQKMHALSAAYNYLEKTNDVALQTVNVYTNLQKEKALLENSRLNVEHNDLTYTKVQKKYDAGLTTLSEVSKIHASLLLAKSNLMLQKNRLLNAHNNFRRVVGKNINLKVLKKVNFNLNLPKSKKKAEKYALEYNPSILVVDYNIKGAEALHRESKSAFYPKVDIELSQNYNENYNEYIGTDDRTQGLVVVSYNLYNGGADEAKKLNTMSRLNQEVSVANDVKRQVTERVNLSWDSYTLSLDQIPFLKQYKKQSLTTLNLYSDEYELGKRSLLDLIAAENDLKRANDESIYAKYNLLLAKYQIMHSMGLIVASIMGSEKEYYQRVGIKKKVVRHSVNNNTYDTLTHAMKVEKSHKNKKNVSVSSHQTISKQAKKNVSASSLERGTVIQEFKKVRWESR